MLVRHHEHLNEHFKSARSNRNLKPLAIALVAFCLVATPAYAQGTGDVQSFVDSVKDFITGTFAKSVAVCAIAFTGYRFFTGRAGYGPLLSVIAGCFIIFGAKWLLDQFVP